MPRKQEFLLDNVNGRIYDLCWKTMEHKRLRCVHFNPLVSLSCVALVGESLVTRNQIACIYG